MPFVRITQPLTGIWHSPAAASAAHEVVWVPPSSSGPAVAASAVSSIAAKPVISTASALAAASVVVDGVGCGLAWVASVLVAAAEKDNLLLGYITRPQYYSQQFGLLLPNFQILIIMDNIFTPIIFLSPKSKQ